MLLEVRQDQPVKAKVEHHHVIHHVLVLDLGQDQPVKAKVKDQDVVD